MKRKYFKDNQGQVFSLDIMIALIIVTVILGISADAMDIASYKAQDYSLRFSLERTTTDAADILIKSPGSPDEWESNGFNPDIIPGLAKKEIVTGKIAPNSLSLIKILKLKNNYNQLMYGKILPDGVNSSMVIYPVNPSLKPLVIRNDKVPINASEVVVANRTVLCDFLYATIMVGINGHLNSTPFLEQGSEWEVCPHMDHNHPDFKTGNPEWACHHFNVAVYDLNSTDFYVITDPVSATGSAEWGIDRADKQIDCKEKFSRYPILVNDKIAAAMGNDTSAVMWFHTLKKEDSKDSFNAYIVGVLKGTPVNQVKPDYLGPQPCFFVLQVWY